MGLMTNILEEKKKEEGAQRLVLSRKSNLESGPTQANLLDESNHSRGHPRRLTRRENKLEMVDGKSPFVSYQCMETISVRKHTIIRRKT